MSKKKNTSRLRFPLELLSLLKKEQTGEIHGIVQHAFRIEGNCALLFLTK